MFIKLIHTLYFLQACVIIFFLVFSDHGLYVNYIWKESLAYISANYE